MDGVSADAPYAEQYAARHLVNVPVIGSAMTLTTIDGVSSDTAQRERNTRLRSHGLAARSLVRASEHGPW